MYTVGENDRVEELKDVPQSDVGAPLPVVLADEHRLYLAYLVSEPDPNWDGSYINMISPDTDGTVAVVTFDRPALHMFGPPNDEAFGGHPLANRGLRPYSVNEIHNSSWVQRRIEMNRIHRMHQDSMFDGMRHFIFAFHDSTFECLADDFSVSLFRGSILAATEHMLGLLADR
ncbi:MAG: hypothetical protein AAFN77_24640 [Planctomycetota bacterium]